MKTKFILSFIAALFMQFTSVSADNYTDGVTKLMENEAIATLNERMFDQFSKLPDVNSAYFKTQFKTDAIEWLADSFRKNMKEKDFNEMVSFFMQPEVLKVQKKVISCAVDMNSVQQTLMPQIQAIAMGGPPEDFKMPDCDPKLKKELLRWLEINGMPEIFKTSMNSATNMVADMAPRNIPEEQMAMMKKTMESLASYMEKNMGAILLTSMVGKVDLKDMQTLNAIEKKPFFASYKKVNLALANDMKPFMSKIMEGIKKK